MSTQLSSAIDELSNGIRLSVLGLDFEAELHTGADKEVILLGHELHVGRYLLNTLVIRVQNVVGSSAQDDFNIAVSSAICVGGLAGTSEDHIDVFVPLRTTDVVEDFVTGCAEVEGVGRILDIDVGFNNSAAGGIDNIGVDVESHLLRGSGSVVALQHIVTR